MDFVIDFSKPFEKAAFIASLNKLKGEQVIFIKKKSKQRSGQQNKYYWVVLEYISESTGFTPFELHVLFREQFLSWVQVGDDFSFSTTGLTTEQFSGYIDLIRTFAETFLGVICPDAQSFVRK